MTNFGKIATSIILLVTLSIGTLGECSPSKGQGRTSKKWAWDPVAKRWVPVGEPKPIQAESEKKPTTAKSGKKKQEPGSAAGTARTPRPQKKEESVSKPPKIYDPVIRAFIYPPGIKRVPANRGTNALPTRRSPERKQAVTEADKKPKQSAPPRLKKLNGKTYVWDRDRWVPYNPKEPK